MDAVKQLYIIRIDGVPVGEENGKLCAFFDENDHPDATLWEIKPAEIPQRLPAVGDLTQAP